MAGGHPRRCYQSVDVSAEKHRSFQTRFPSEFKASCSQRPGTEFCPQQLNLGRGGTHFLGSRSPLALTASLCHRRRRSPPRLPRPLPFGHPALGSAWLSTSLKVSRSQFFFRKSRVLLHNVVFIYSKGKQEASRAAKQLPSLCCDYETGNAGWAVTPCRWTHSRRRTLPLTSGGHVARVTSGKPCVRAHGKRCLCPL